jgi:Cu2+-exporting ATPase
LLAPDGTRLGSAAFVGTLAADTGGPSLWLTRPGQAPVVFRFFDPPRPGAKDLVEAFRARGLAPTLLSGDRAASVAALADEVGIDRWRAEMTPEDKLDAVQQAGGRALMIGDGLNDAPALAAAHVSVSPASAIDIARNAADIVVLAKRLDVVSEAHALAVQAQRLIAQNLSFAALYNIVSVPLALTGGLTPLIAAILMSSSSLLVMLNALRLRIRP